MFQLPVVSSVIRWVLVLSDDLRWFHMLLGGFWWFHDSGGGSVWFLVLPRDYRVFWWFAIRGSQWLFLVFPCGSWWFHGVPTPVYEVSVMGSL